MSKFAATPFSQLLGVLPRRLPKSAASTVVVAGRTIRDVREIRHAEPAAERLAEDHQDVLAQRRAVQRAKEAARYQRARLDPAKMAKRAAWYAAHRDEVLAYQREWRRAHAAAQRLVKTEWARAQRLADPEKGRAASRAYYARHRETVLAKKRAKRAEARATAMATVAAPCA